MPERNGYKMKNEEYEAEKKWLRQLYLEDLTKMVTYGGNPRPRVRHPNNWHRLNKDVEFLAEGVEQPADLTDRKVWVWTDQHFYHKNIIGFCDRPFTNVDHMTEHLIANYNEYVGKDDVCIWGGDVGFGNDRQINNVLRRCNGYKILVIGNHDLNKGKLRHLDFDEIHLVYLLENVLFTHYPMDNIPWPWFNVHGHLHVGGTLNTGAPDLQYNANCELHGYRPVEFDEIRRIAKIRIEAYEQ